MRKDSPTAILHVVLKADKTTEAGVLPSSKDLEVMGKYNEQLIKAGVMLDCAGLQPSSKQKAAGH